MKKEYSSWDKKSIDVISGKKANFSELVKDCVAFANHKGGHLHIGIEDKEDLPYANQTISIDLAENAIRRLNELSINLGLNYQICTAENGGQYLDIEIYQSRSSVASTTKGGYYMRDNDKSRALLPDELIRLVGDKPSYCWETKSTNVSCNDADIVKVNYFVSEIKQSDRVSTFVKQKTDRELIEHYLMMDENGMLTNLGVLWLGKQSQRARLLYSPVVQYIRYDNFGQKVYKRIWDGYDLNPKELLESIWNEVPEWKESNEVSEGLWRINIPAFDEKVVREALANAIVHRPYTTRGDVFINMYPDRMEIINPGQLPYGVTSSTILHKSVQRNEHLSKVFHDLHLMEKEGSGYDLMYEVLLQWGKSLPIIEEGDDYVKLTISRLIIDKEAYRLYEFLSDNYKVSQKSKIVFGIICQQKKVKSIELTKMLQFSSDDRLRDYVKPLLDQNVIVTSGKGKSTAYSLNPKFVSVSKANVKTSLKTIEPYRLQALIEEDLKYHPQSSLEEIGKRLPDVDFSNLQQMVRTMAKDGTLCHNEGRKFRKYWLPESFK